MPHIITEIWYNYMNDVVEKIKHSKIQPFTDYNAYHWNNEIVTLRDARQLQEDMGLLTPWEGIHAHGYSSSVNQVSVMSLRLQEPPNIRDITYVLH